MSDPSDLCTLNDVLAWLTFPVSSNDQNTLARLITAASDYIHRYLCRYIPQANYIEVRDGEGGSKLLFGAYPVTAVSSLAINGIAVPPSPNATTAGYTFTQRALILRGNYVFSRARQNLNIAYTAGYTTIPPALQQAAIELVAERFAERGREGIAQENVVGISTTTFRPLDMTLSIKSAIDRFRNVAPITNWDTIFAPGSGPDIPI